MSDMYESGENYLETILLLHMNRAVNNVHSIDIANYLGYSKPSVSRAMKILIQRGYVTMARDGELDLTDEGMVIAKGIYEKHLLLTKYFVQLGVNPETAERDACRIEHIISEETLQKIKENLE